MSVELFVQPRDGNFNFHIELEDKMAAHKVIELIRETQGYWYEGTVEFKPTRTPSGTRARCKSAPEDRVIFIPYQIIDRMEIR